MYRRDRLTLAEVLGILLYGIVRAWVGLVLAAMAVVALFIVMILFLPQAWTDQAAWPAGVAVLLGGIVATAAVVGRQVAGEYRRRRRFSRLEAVIDETSAPTGGTLKIAVSCIARQALAVDHLRIALVRTLVLVDHDYDEIDRQVATDDQWLGYQGRNPIRGDEIGGVTDLRLSDDTTLAADGNAFRDGHPASGTTSITAQWHVEVNIALDDGTREQLVLHPKVRGYEVFGLVDLN